MGNLYIERVYNMNSKIKISLDDSMVDHCTEDEIEELIYFVTSRKW